MTKLSNIYERMRNDIARGELPLGQKITVDDLATRYQVGHMPVREAVRRLLGEEILQRVPGAGTQVRQISAAYISEFSDVTNALQSILVRAAASRCGPDDITQLKTLERDRCRNIAEGDFAEALNLNHDFHDRIYAIAKNDHALKLLKSNRILMSALWHKYGYGPSRHAGVENDHLNIIRALERRDPEAAAVLNTAHNLKAKFELLERATCEEAQIVPGQEESTFDGH